MSEVNNFHFGPVFEANYLDKCQIISESLYYDKEYKDKIKSFNSSNKYFKSMKLYKSQKEIFDDIEKTLGMKAEEKILIIKPIQYGAKHMISYIYNMKKGQDIYSIEVIATPTVDGQFKDVRINMLKKKRK